MKCSLKTTLLTFTVLSAGFLPLVAHAAGGFTRPAKKEIALNKDVQQYPKLTEIKKDVQQAVDLHETAVSLLDNKKVLEEFKKNIAEYKEIVRRRDQNISCNIQQLSDYFSDPKSVWDKMAAYAEDSSAKLLAAASDSLGDKETTNQVKALQADLDAGKTSSSASAGSSAKVDAALKANEGIDINNIGEDSSDVDLDAALAFSKIRWDVGKEVLVDVYANQDKWGTVKKRFSPWVDQKHVYDVYLAKRYAEMEKAYAPMPGQSFPVRPKITDKDGAYLPQTYYQGNVPVAKATTTNYSDSSATLDDVFCGKTAANKKKQCVRVNKGELLEKHNAYVAALTQLPLKEGASTPDLSAPYLPQIPLPPWREVVFIQSVEKEIPQYSSGELPDPWFKVTQSIDNFTPSGELANLVSRKGNTVEFKKGTYDELTGEIKIGQNGGPEISIPMIQNRLSSYLALTSAEEEKLPVKERAEASIKEMNENLRATFIKAGFTPSDSFDLAKDADYQEALKKLRELEQNKVKEARIKSADLRSEFGASLLPSVEKMLNDEATTMNALDTDTESLVRVTHENAAEINDLLRQAIADAEAQKAYEDNVASQMGDTDPVPDVGCPVL